MFIWLLVKVLAILMILFGGGLFLLSSGPKVHQPDEFGIASIVIGIILVLAGIYILFS